MVDHNRGCNPNWKLRCLVSHHFIRKLLYRFPSDYYELDGHRASDWPKEHTWAGKLKISAKGRLAVIRLLDSTTGQVFASCTVTDDSCVERTLDSGRYFVLKIQNAQGRHAFIGIAFNERNDAFDFNVALQEHKAGCEREDRALEPSTTSICAPLRDLSLKAGEKITVKIAGSANVRSFYHSSYAYVELMLS